MIRLSEHAEPVGDGISVTGPDGREVAHGPVDRRPGEPHARDRRAAAGLLRGRVARRRRRLPSRARRVPLQRRRADQRRASPVRRARAACLEVLGRWLSLLGFALGFGVPFAALLSGGMTAQAVAARLGRRRPDDRGRAGRPARPDGAPRPVAHVRSAADRGRPADELRAPRRRSGSEPPSASGRSRAPSVGRRHGRSGRSPPLGAVVAIIEAGNAAPVRRPAGGGRRAARRGARRRVRRVARLHRRRARGVARAGARPPGVAGGASRSS